MQILSQITVLRGADGGEDVNGTLTGKWRITAIRCRRPLTTAAAARTQSYVYDAANRLDKACEANTGVTGCTVNSSFTWTGSGYGEAYGYDAYSNRWIEPTGTVPTLILQPTSAAAFESSTNRFNTALFGGTYDGAGDHSGG
ncbi:MAG: hypothetical protein ACKV2U_14965 [Bryobacteraceae bacterium]